MPDSIDGLPSQEKPPLYFHDLEVDKRVMTPDGRMRGEVVAINLETQEYSIHWDRTKAPTSYDVKDCPPEDMIVAEAESEAVLSTTRERMAT